MAVPVVVMVAVAVTFIEFDEAFLAVAILAFGLKFKG